VKTRLRCTDENTNVKGLLFTLSRGLTFTLPCVLAVVAMRVAPARADDLIEPDVSVLKLRAQATAHGDTLKLSDVLNFANADARLIEQIADQPLLGETPNADKCSVTHEQVAQRLAELRVNMARVLVSGALLCEVTIARPAAPGKPTEKRGATGDAGKPQTPVAAGNTLAAALSDRIAKELAARQGKVEVEFERAGAEALELTTPPFEFVIHSAGGDELGLREFSVVIRRDGKTQRSLRVTARVTLVREVMVARRPLNIGTFVRAEDLERQSRIFESLREPGIDKPEELVGQQVKRFIAAGDLVRRGDVKVGDLVQRSRPVTVLGAAGGVQVRLTGTALDSGGYGDSVRVRLGESRKDRRELKAVVAGPGTVKIEGNGT
jgi:flagella basal body P-ring formation protein FlgA